MSKLRTDLKIIDSDNLLIDQLLPNIRGATGNTVDLQNAIREENLMAVFPLKVVPHPTQEDTYLVWDGARRLTAGRKIGLTSFTCIVVDITPEEAISPQLAANMREEQPQIVMDSDGNVIAGLCWAAHELSVGGKSLSQIAIMMGLSSTDTASAYVSLFDEIEEVQQRVRIGELGITVYSRLKKQPDETKLAILEKKGNISRAFVDRYLKDSRVRDAMAAKTGVAVEDDELTRVDYRAALAERFEEKGGNIHGRLQSIVVELNKLVWAKKLDAKALYLVEEIAGIVDDALGFGLEER